MPHHGARPQDVVDGVLSRYLVQTTARRIVAYRIYKENSVGYFKADELSRLHWEYLHGQAAALPEQDASDLPPESRRFPKRSHCIARIARHPVRGLKGIRPRYGDEDEVRAMVPGYIEAEDDPLQMEIQGDERQSQSAEINAFKKH